MCVLVQLRFSFVLLVGIIPWLIACGGSTTPNNPTPNNPTPSNPDPINNPTFYSIDSSPSENTLYIFKALVDKFGTDPSEKEIKLIGINGRVYAIDFHPDGTLYGVVGEQGQEAIYSIDEATGRGTRVSTITQAPGSNFGVSSVVDVDFHPDGFLRLISNGNSMYRLDIQTGNLSREHRFTYLVSDTNASRNVSIAGLSHTVTGDVLLIEGTSSSFAWLVEQTATGSDSIRSLGQLEQGSNQVDNFEIAGDKAYVTALDDLFSIDINKASSTVGRVTKLGESLNFKASVTFK
jgi:hypothetical protein